MLLPEAPPDPVGPILRDYQAQIVGEVSSAIQSGKSAVLVQLVTGGGKTATFYHIVARLNRKMRRALIVVHRRELLKQTSTALHRAGVRHGYIAAGFPESDDRIQVAMIQTIAGRLGDLPRFDYLILDEAHHAVANQWRNLIASQPQAVVLGFTATPELLSGQGLGIECGGVFDHLIVGPQADWLIEQSHLSRYVAYAPSAALDLSGVANVAGDYEQSGLADAIQQSAIVGDAVAAYEKHAAGRAAIVFCISIAEADKTALAFREAGWRSVSASGQTRMQDRDAAITGLATGDVQILCTCDLISEGLDVPSVGAVILLRPTQSLALYLQQVGRGLRPAPGKDHLVILDHVGNTLRHGLPDAEREWSLEGRKRRSGDAESLNIVRCPSCFAMQRPGRACAQCGTILVSDDEAESGGRQIETIAGELAEVNAEAIRTRQQVLRDTALRDLLRPGMSYRELDEIRLARGYARGWTFHKMKELSPHRLSLRRAG